MEHNEDIGKERDVLDRPQWQILNKYYEFRKIMTTLIL